MDERVLARVCREIGVADLVERLSSRVSPSDLQSVLLELARRRTARRSPADLVERYRRDGTVGADSQDARTLGRLAMAAFDAVPTYEAVELSPVEPLGVNTVLAGLDQSTVLATARATDVVADPTVVLALHAAVRRRGGSIRCECALATASCARRRSTRPPDATSGCSRSCRPLDRRPITCQRSRRCASTFWLTSQSRRRLGSSVPASTTCTEAVNYYNGLQLRIDATHDGVQREVADGGSVDWMAKLLSDQHERLFTSGAGLERLRA